MKGRRIEGWGRKGKANRSLKWLLIQRLVILQILVFVAILGILFVRGDLFAYRSIDRTIEAVRPAVERDATGALHLRETAELSHLRAAEPGLWFVIRDDGGNQIFEGAVPPVFVRIGETLSGIGQARFGSTVDSAAMDTPEARMRQVTTSAGEVQILTGTESQAPLTIIFLAALLVLIKIGLPTMGAIVLGVFIATPYVVAGAVSGLVEAETQAAKIDFGKHGVRLDATNAPPEIASLIEAVNEALRRLDARYEQQQRFLTDAAHELRTPIAILRTRIAALPLIAEKASLSADLARLTMLAEQLLDVGRLQNDALAFAPVSLPALAKRVLGDMAPLAFAAGYTVDFRQEGSDLPILGDEAALERVLANLVQNAIDHGGRRGRITLRVSPATVAISDDGPGIPSEERNRIFEPFHRLKPQTRGTGLGLHLVKQMVELHGGEIGVSASPSGGACMTIRFQIQNLANPTELANIEIPEISRTAYR
ncbi:hypothetical protein ASC97_24465 [Rhizobium sp. Root1203]|uniref:sensor histidine kinase n=1 Tax=Rhizobium sp. Root1203 TaxID=1736427 RepID=UPI00070B637A|nr:HAMP domain-containing sensor histidine kinase [Rhizobium sp. Root1203]KQV27087.1 hypothetical protein ASC97_24465 [Rhizobium sp. Root1203]